MLGGPRAGAVPPIGLPQQPRSQHLPAPSFPLLQLTHLIPTQPHPTQSVTTPTHAPTSPSQAPSVSKPSQSNPSQRHNQNHLTPTPTPALSVFQPRQTNPKPPTPQTPYPLPLTQAMSVEGQVSRLVTEAVDHDNLARMYIWWMPWF